MTFSLSRRKAILAATSSLGIFLPGSNLFATDYTSLQVAKKQEKQLVQKSEHAQYKIAEFHKKYPTLEWHAGKTYPRGKWVLRSGKWTETTTHYGIWEQTETKVTYRRRQICDSQGCRWITYPVKTKTKKRYRVRFLPVSTQTKQTTTYLRPRIPTPRMFWVYYGGNYGQPLRNHLAYHGLSSKKLYGLSDYDLRKLHSLAHLGNLSRYWYA